MSPSACRGTMSVGSWSVGDVEAIEKVVVVCELRVVLRREVVDGIQLFGRGWTEVTTSDDIMPLAATRCPRRRSVAESDGLLGVVDVDAHHSIMGRAKGVDLDCCRKSLARRGSPPLWFVHHGVNASAESKSALLISCLDLVRETLVVLLVAVTLGAAVFEALVVPIWFGVEGVALVMQAALVVMGVVVVVVVEYVADAIVVGDRCGAVLEVAVGEQVLAEGDVER